MKPIIKLNNAVFSDNLEKLQKLCKKHGIELTKVHKDMFLNKKRDLCKYVFSKWIPAAEAILEMVVSHLPSPRVAQRYRVKYLYEGPQTDAVA